jgi:hypothetical protein
MKSRRVLDAERYTRNASIIFRRHFRQDGRQQTIHVGEPDEPEERVAEKLG